MPPLGGRQEDVQEDRRLVDSTDDLLPILERIAKAGGGMRSITTGVSMSSWLSLGLVLALAGAALPARAQTPATVVEIAARAPGPLGRYGRGARREPLRATGPAQGRRSLLSGRGVIGHEHSEFQLFAIVQVNRQTRRRVRPRPD